jgi:BASS family bile acid:Na+ symporter
LFGTYAVFAGVLFVIASFGIGYLLGWPKKSDRLAMGFMHGARNLSVAVITAGSMFKDQPNAMLMIAFMAILMLVLLILASSIFKIKPGAE